MVSRRRSPSLLVAGAVLALSLVAAGCGAATHQQPDLARGKLLFTGVPRGKEPTAVYQPCSACHALARANAKATRGPNLDDAFATARRDGFNERTIQGVTEDQIAYPRRNSIMPRQIVTGNDARDVAAYIAAVAGVPGKDTGLLASIGVVKSGKPISAQSGVLTIPANETGALAFASNKATAPAGPIDIKMPNPSPLQHDIAIKGDGTGPTVGTGGVSELKTTLKPGQYEFYCTVPGHEAGGMKGTLTVK